MAMEKQTDIYNIIGRNLRKFRMERGYTQRGLSEALLLSESFIAKLEAKTYQTISIDTLLLIANFLDVDITSFFDENILNEEIHRKKKSEKKKRAKSEKKPR